MAGRRGGRPPAEAGSKPNPMSLKARERLAICLAYLEASEDGATADLEQMTRDRYAAQLDHVLGQDADVLPHIDPWEDSVHRAKGSEVYTFTAEESKQRRTEGTAGNTELVKVFKDTRNDCVNQILPAYMRLYTAEGSPPTGSAREELIKSLREDLLREATMGQSPAGQADGGDADDTNVGHGHGGIGGAAEGAGDTAATAAADVGRRPRCRRETAELSTSRV
jgi:hypothetical protein